MNNPNTYIPSQAIGFEFAFDIGRKCLLLNSPGICKRWQRDDRNGGGRNGACQCWIYENIVSASLAGGEITDS